MMKDNPSTLNAGDEVNVNSHLEIWIRRKMPKKCPFDIQHTPPELLTRITSSRPPPTPDFGFFPWSDRRVMFPLEAKVLQTDRGISQYVKALRTRFLQCRYAPHSSEGVMMAYLLSGDSATLFKKLRSRLRIALFLNPHPDFSKKPHRISRHERKHRKCRNCPINFDCHHLVMVMYLTKNAAVINASQRRFSALFPPTMRD